MAEIKPFRGIRYAWQDLEEGEIGRLVAPPYDVVDSEEQESLYQSHPANIVRLDLNRIQPDDDDENNRYVRARRHLMDWLAQGILVVEKEATIYLHEQIFSDEAGNRYARRGFISLVGLAEYEERVVLPHERTLRGPKQDRLDLMKATECNLSQVFFLYDDPKRQVDEILFTPEVLAREPDVEISTDDGIVHRLWAVGDEKVHEQVAEAFAGQSVLIADGHHRYETALAYRDFRRSVAEEHQEGAPYEYVMGFLVNIHDPGLQVFPTHRVVHSVEDFSFEELRERLEKSADFEVEEISGEELADFGGMNEALAARGEKGPSFAIIGPESKEGLWVRFVGDERAEFFGDETPEDVRKLDVTILHEGIFEDLLGIDKAAQAARTNLDYVQSLEEGRQMLLDGAAQLVALMNPTPVEVVNQVCTSGGLMPQKSTFFYPKVLSGLLINPL